MTIEQVIISFVDRLINLGYIQSVDKIYFINRLLPMFELDKFPYDFVEKRDLDLRSCLSYFEKYAIDNKLISNVENERHQFIYKITDLYTPLPSIVNYRFWEYYKSSPIKATDFFYRISQDNDYIRVEEINKNIHFEDKTIYGDLEITINKSKKEKTPAEISKAKDKKGKYPTCELCFENEGFKGTKIQSARQNHRIIRLELGDELFGMQYSPFSYYKEHCIL